MSGPIQSLNIEVTNLKNKKADTSEIPTKVSQLENDANYISEQ